MVRLCAAYTRDGKACKNLAGPTGFCRHHRPRPVKTVTPRLFINDYLNRTHEDDFVSLRSESAVLQGLISQTVEGLQSRNSQANWKELGLLAKEYGLAKTPEHRLTVAGKMCTQIQTGVEIWRQAELLLGYMEFKRKLAEHEQKRAKMAEEMMDPKQAKAMVASLVAAVEKFVPDPAVRKAIGEEFTRVGLPA